MRSQQLLCVSPHAVAAGKVVPRNGTCELRRPDLSTTSCSFLTANLAWFASMRTTRMRKSIHVLPSGNGWKTQHAGSSRPDSNHRTQGNAEAAARAVAKREGAEVVIHRPNGQIRESNSYGNDPFPPRG